MHHFLVRYPFGYHPSLPGHEFAKIVEERLCFMFLIESLNLLFGELGGGGGVKRRKVNWGTINKDHNTPKNNPNDLNSIMRYPPLYQNKLTPLPQLSGYSPSNSGTFLLDNLKALLFDSLEDCISVS